MTGPEFQMDTRPDTVRTMRFRRHPGGGYDPEQVHAYLAAIAESLKRLQDDRAAEKSDPFSVLGHRAAEILRAADEQASTYQREAERRGRRRIDEAIKRAESIVHKANAQATEIRRRSVPLLEVELRAREILLREEGLRASLLDLRKAMLRSLARLESTRDSGLAAAKDARGATPSPSTRTPLQQAAPGADCSEVISLGPGGRRSPVESSTEGSPTEGGAPASV